MGQSEEINLQLQALIRIKSEQTFMEVLCHLKDLLGSKSVGDLGDLEKCKQELYYNGVMTYCSEALRFSPAKIEGGYASITQIADILSTCCVGIGSVKDEEAFLHQFLPSAAENLLFLAHRIMNQGVGDKGEAQRIRLFRKVFDALGWFLSGYPHLIPSVLKSTHYENVQMSEDDDISAVIATLWYNLFRTNSLVISDMGSNAVRSIVDDIVYKMSNSSNPVIGCTAVRILLLMIEQNGDCRKLLHKQYQGLADLIQKDWRGKGFDSALEQLIDQLQAELPEAQLQQSKHLSKKRVKAACVIQAAWRAYKTRCRLKKLPRAVSVLQRSFREKRRRQQVDKEKCLAEEELRHQVCLRRQQAIRQFRQRQLHLMEILPANQLAQFLGELENKAALMIQRVWRGYRARRHFQQSRYQLKQHKAAVTLQRAVLRFLKQRRSLQTMSPWRGPKGLTDSRRTELRRQIEEHISLHPSSVSSVEGTLELHEKAQCLLQQYLLNKVSHRTQEQHSQALVAQINTDLELLTNAPSLKDMSEVDATLFLSRSAPVAMRARQAHSALLRGMHLPWWKMLGEELSSSEAPSQTDYDVELESLYLGGS